MSKIAAATAESALGTFLRMARAERAITFNPKITEAVILERDTAKEGAGTETFFGGKATRNRYFL